MAISAKDVQRLRQMTGAGMMDCKKALEDTDGDVEKAATALREKGLASSAKREDRESSQGAVAVKITDAGSAIVEIRCETDFVAKSDAFKGLVDELAALVAAKGPDATSEKSSQIDDLKVTLKENIELGRMVHYAANPATVVDSYLHVQNERGVLGVLVEAEGISQEIAHDIAVHIAFAKPDYLTRDEVPADDVEAERKTLEAQTRNEGKPEAALPKIVEGKLNGFFKERVLLEQGFAKDDKQSVQQVIGEGKIVRFAWVKVG